MEITSAISTIRLTLDWDAIAHDNLLTIQTQGGATHLSIASLSIELA